MTPVQIATAVLSLIAGIGIFLIACTMMSSNLESVSSNKLKQLFARTSKSKLVGVGIGTVATAAIQSSGATTVMVIGFVNAGIMSLIQAATVIYGANIGTTITGQITALGMFENSISTGVVFATFAGIGAFTMAFAKKDLVKKIGGILAGFGMLFVGLDMMSASMDTFASLDTVKNFLASISNPLLLVLIGTILTAIIQSSSVMTSIAITMVFTGLINLDQGIYLTMGSNIGSCVVAIIAGLTSSTNAKRTALLHLLFNVSGVVIFMLVAMMMREISKAVNPTKIITFGYLFGKMFPGVPQTQLAMFHTIFNVITVIIMLPLTNLSVKLVCKILPDKKKKDEQPAEHFYYIDEHMLSTPPIAVQQTKNEIVNMAEIALHNYDLACDVICTLDYSKIEKFRQNENELNFLNKEIARFVVKLSKLEMNDDDHNYLATTFHTITDLERVGDYAENIIEYADKLKESDQKFSDVAISEVRNLQSRINDLFQKVMKAYVNSDAASLDEANVIEDEIDDITEAMGANHIERLRAGDCTPDVGAQYLSLASNSERVADHFINVGKSINGTTKKKD
ncbi:na/Pi-cotransporter II-like protein [Firmicutes bacterium CAG:475]|nr:na/Pi-cotransporter II-like protein [Firmicutes bacterium CAG:475]